jgi:hypothetical protein
VCGVHIIILWKEFSKSGTWAVKKALTCSHDTVLFKRIGSGSLSASSK